MKLITKLWEDAKQLWERAFIRFLFVGGFNTLFGLGLIFLFDNLIGENVNLHIYKMSFSLALAISFVVGIPVAYSTQSMITFRQKWQLKRLLIYPFTSLPNYFLQQLVFSICVDIFKLENEFAYLMSVFVPLPIMFFIIRFFVSKKVKS